MQLHHAMILLIGILIGANVGVLAVGLMRAGRSSARSAFVAAETARFGRRKSV